tara:strand:+ start:740 stop:1021 length:282 start_codon:yes stop_codon:yes gene_type:complete
MREIEKALEKKINAEVKNLGGWSIKILSTLISGLPDRLALLPGGRVYFIELKSEGKKPSPIQKIIHNKLAALGFAVHVIDTTEKINNFIESIK